MSGEKVTEVVTKVTTVTDLRRAVESLGRVELPPGDDRIFRELIQAAAIAATFNPEGRGFVRLVSIVALNHGMSREAAAGLTLNEFYRLLPANCLPRSAS